MDEQAWLTHHFEQDRARLRAVAYRMLGSYSEADDAVQEAWLRIDRSGGDGVENPAAWLTTVVARVCLNMLRSRRARREEPVADYGEHGGHAERGGHGGPAPGGGEARGEAADPEQQAVLSDSVGLALLVVLDTLTPAERIAFVLHDMFAVPFDEIGPMIDRSPVAARQLASRARRRVKEGARPPETDRARRRRVVEAFLAASREGDFDALVAVLDPEVVFRADAATVPGRTPVMLRGAHNVAKGASAAAQRARETVPGLVDGSPALVRMQQGRVSLVLTFTVVGDLITGIEAVADPERLRTLDVAVLDG
ncbi:sigma-70 family RNA polymerase sigma factor [Streptomonospora wellingtoniae]|uniref:Sigma-70 family RNA polymerase sigma factor n=1 Tax=Streptomonospora wellingtoniae TaxID=3075544 RepID=A0ABU2KTS5_9ACTN|nr:sigma-70 family RNA polymerase sigma factor [Streptomonospora sp. DSM 45055]MDT0302679.1 sigma-70 family RNA polymerase sigma factor [Streptomonospora sp. DSM 45055]